MLGKAFQAEGTEKRKAGMDSAGQRICEKAGVVGAELTRGARGLKGDLRGKQGWASGAL